MIQLPSSLSRFPKSRKQNAIAGIGAAFACTALAALLAASPLAARAQGTGTSFTSFTAFPGVTSAPTTTPPYLTANLTLGSDGNFYGTRGIGGTHNDGTVFEETPSGTLTTVYNFANGSDGEYPFGQLVQIGGLFYGVTSTTVFSVTSSGTLTTLHTFASATEGTDPAGGLVLAGDGNLYGTTSSGGANNSGTIFQITPAGALTVLYSFSTITASGSSSDGDANTDGAYPNSPLTIGTDGNMYGTTFRGGANDFGTVYKLSAGTLTTLYSFDGGTDGAQSDGVSSGSTVSPIGPLVQASDGSFYGTAEVGGNGTGVVYKITSTGTLTPIYQFDATPFSSGGGPSSSTANDNGANPVGGLIIGSDGALYGSTEFGGTNGDGLLFRLTTSGTYDILHTFAAAASSTNSTNSDGDFPAASFVPYTDGSLYGATSLGGSHGSGTLFKLVPGTFATAPTTETRFDFNQDGHADLIWYNTGSGALSVWDMNDTTVLQFGAAFAQLAPSTGWQPVAAPDVNDDGVPDLIWWNNQTGELSPWTLAAGTPPTVTNFGADFATIPDTTWKPVAAADVTGTTWELVFQNTVSGDISRWLMNGTTVVQYGGTLSSVGAGSGWQCVGAPDLDGDGKSDLLFWNSQTGEVSYWSTDLNANTVLAYHGDFAQVSDTSWHLQGSEDTNGDGSPDLIWWNANSGIESRWLLNGTTVTQYGGGETQVTDTTWQPTAIR